MLLTDGVVRFDRSGPVSAVSATGLSCGRSSVPARCVCQPVQAQPLLRRLIGRLCMGPLANYTSMHPGAAAQDRGHMSELSPFIADHIYPLFPDYLGENALFGFTDHHRNL